MRRAEIFTAGGFLVIAGIALAEAVRLGFGYEKWGPAAGFILFWLAVLTALCGGVIMLQGWRMKGREDFFPSRPALRQTGWVALTAAFFCVLFWSMGAYIAIALYSALFSGWLGKHRWYSVLAFAILTPIIVYFGMEKGLMVPLPKSPVYARGWLPF